MRKKVGLALAAIVVLVALWLSVAGVAWSRNRVPALALPAPEAMPAGNVYDEYVQCVSAVPAADQRLLEQYAGQGSLPPAARQAILARNSALLARFHGLIGRPCMVTVLEPGAQFVPAQQFPFLTWLVALESDEQRAKDPTRALDTLLDGLTFGEEIMRGGAVLHLSTSAITTLPAFIRLPAVLPGLSAPLCEQGAARVRALLENEYPLSKILQHERLIRDKRLIAIMEPLAGQVLRFKIPTEGYAWQYMMRPKTAALTSLDTYLANWAKEAEKPIYEVTPPAPPTGLEGILTDDSLKPENYVVPLYRYHYKQARLQLAYTGFLLERYRKTHGQYPASLSELGSDPYLTDPFSGKPFIYHREGSSFVLYSVGPNGQDDGNAPEPPGRSFSIRRPSDIAFVPQFAASMRR